MKPDCLFIAIIAFLLLIAYQAIRQFLQSGDTWHRCPKCRRWHSDAGVMNHGIAPSPYQQRGEPKVCEVCK